MNIKDRMILEEFKKEKENFIKLEQIAVKKLQDIVSESKVLVTGIEHRVKNEDSLEIKLYKKGDHYQTMYDLTDLLGTRVICYFADDVSKIGKMVEERFDIDWDNSMDKSTLMDANSFGYLSIHYICSLKKDEGYPEELTNKRFELQVRSILQHAWAAINHDLGYKTEFGVPKEVVREFARLAGLLEIADSEFARTRDHITEYTEDIRSKIINDNAENVNVDIISLREYMLRNKKMREFLNDLAAIENSEITESDPDNYIEQLRWLKINTIGQLQELLERNKTLALELARKVLEGSELDIIASNVALRFVCQAELVNSNYSEEDIVEFMLLSVKSKSRAERQAKRLFNMKKDNK